MSDDPVQVFIGRAQAAGAEVAIVACQAEWALTTARGFGPVRRARLLAYAGGEVIAEDIPGDSADHEAITTRLTAAGLRVEQRSRNLSSVQGLRPYGPPGLPPGLCRDSISSEASEIVAASASPIVCRQHPSAPAPSLSDAAPIEPVPQAKGIHL